MKPARGIFLLTLFFSLFSLAATEEIDTLAKDFADTKKRIEDAELKQRQVLSALYQLNKKIKKSVTERGEMAQQRAFLELNIRQLTEKVEELEKRSKSHRALLAERLRAIYKLGGPSVARFLFSSSSAATLERNLKILGVVAARDLELIKNYRHDLEDLTRKRKSLASRLESFKDIELKIVAQEKKLLQEQALKNKLLSGIRRNKMFALNRIQGLREKSLHYNLEDAGLFDLLFKPSFADQKGSLPTPLSGVVTKKFGLIKGEGHNYSLSHKGIYIAAAVGTAVKAVFDGKVSYRGDIPGFGETLIVDHGDHYYTVYAHTEGTQVKEGDEVTQSQVLAQVADSPQERSSGLYFEIRHFSEPYDPQQWMKGL